MNNLIKLFVLFLIVATIVDSAPTDNSNDLINIDENKDLKIPDWPWKKKKPEIKPNPDGFDSPTTNTYKFDVTDSPGNVDSDPTDNSNDLINIDENKDLKMPDWPGLPNWPWNKKKPEIKPNPDGFDTPTTNTYKFDDVTESPGNGNPGTKKTKKGNGLTTPQIILIVVIALVLASALTYYIMYLRKKQLRSNFQQI